MGHLSESVDVDAPLELCWALNADAARLTEWNKAILEVLDVTGPLDRVGTTYTGVVRAMGRKFDGRNVVTRVEPMKSVETTGSGVGGAKARVRAEFERRGTGTRVTVSIDYDLPGGPFGGIAEKLFATRQLESDLKASNVGFKALAESDYAKQCQSGASGTNTRA
ncbi:MAG TPA: SRPBCC family protein [Candidatus Saccharimonadales bacterium]|nr:SRPBCC family protein [Candidatus Saccharimonadales bacterium]